MKFVAPRKVVSVGLSVGSDAVEHLPFSSSNTLLDWDLVVFVPDIASMISYGDTFQGKTSLYEDQSFRLKEQCEHWRREIKGAVDAGRTVICYLPAVKELWVDSGKREYSGTGRNQKTTRLLSPYSNYECVPLNLKPRNASGRSMKLSAKAAVLASYWSAFSEASTFELVIDGDQPTGAIQTRLGDHTVGGVYNSKSGGNLVLLPMLDFYADEYFAEDEEDEDGDAIFSSIGKEIGARLHAAWLGIDSALRAETELTPAPSWAEQERYSLHAEALAKAELLEAEEALTLAQRRKEETTDRLKEAGSLRALLYEKGVPLEEAIITALKAIGFSAAPYKDNDSEFDVVFHSAEGRLLGEAEGRDNKAINVDKLRQLAMNIHEDLARDEVTTAAKAVLFGNGHRLLEPSSRPDCFTEKCIGAAMASSTGLIATVDLFEVARFAIESADKNFATLCRVAILEGVGKVELPPIPVDRQDIHAREADVEGIFGFTKQ